MAKKRLSLSILRHLGSITSDGYVVYDFREHEVLYANHSVSEILKIEEVRPFTLNFLKLYINEDDTFVDACVSRLLEEGKIENVEARLSAADQFVAISAHMLRGDELIIVSFKDITKPKQFLRYITEFGAMKDATLDMIAHNLSGPLNLTDTLLSAIDRLPGHQQNKIIGQYTALIRENTQRCIETINSLLEEEHFASEKIYVKNSRFNAVAHVQLVVNRMRPFHDKVIVLTLSSPEIFVSFDDVKFFQVIHNLVSNALKFTPVRGEVKVDVNEDDHHIYVSVADNGIGIPSYLQPHIFERNTPAGRPGLKGEKSIGMGLYIVKKLIRLMAGSIHFDSEENEGTTFTVSLPKVYLRKQIEA